MIEVDLPDMKLRLLLTCEHGGNLLPAEYAEAFREAQAALASHRGYDPGALELASTLAMRLAAPLIQSTTSRLLVELNRSLHHRSLFSEFTRPLANAVRQAILEEHYHPYRRQVEGWIEEAIAGGDRVLHVSVHTFTPELNGAPRLADVGLLYDPCRAQEKRLCETWRSELLHRRPDLRVRRNYPYLGKADGLTTHLRRKFGDEYYAGIELEVNQLWPQKAGDTWRALQVDLADTLEAARRGGS